MAVVKNNSVTAADNDANDPSSNMEPGTARDDDSSLDLQLSIHVLNKIDRHILPLLFVTYNFNFMDKIILASASVFGIREDNVSTNRSSVLWLNNGFQYSSNRPISILSGPNIAGSPASFTSGTYSGPIQLQSWFKSCPWVGMYLWMRFSGAPLSH